MMQHGCCSYFGLLHSLSADWTPVPQVLEQWDQAVHSPQPPFTVSGSLPTITHSPEIHHWKRKSGKIAHYLKTICNAIYCFKTKKCKSSSTHRLMTSHKIKQQLPPTFSGPQRVPSIGASSLERQEPFTEHQRIWQTFWKKVWIQ